MHHPGGLQAPHYMMAAFALFSFNFPIISSYPSQGTAHGHTGLVPTPPLVLASDVVSSLVAPLTERSTSTFLVISGWKGYFQVVRLAVSVALLASFLWSWLGYTIHKRKEAVTTPTVQMPPNGKVHWNAVADDAVLQDALLLSSCLPFRILTTITGKLNSLSTLSSPPSKTATVSQLTSLSVILSHNASPFEHFA